MELNGSEATMYKLCVAYSYSLTAYSVYFMFMFVVRFGEWLHLRSFNIGEALPGSG